MVWGYQQDMACREVIFSFSKPSAAGKMNMFSDTQVFCRSERKAEAKPSLLHKCRSLLSLLYSISSSNLRISLFQLCLVFVKVTMTLDIRYDGDEFKTFSIIFSLSCHFMAQGNKVSNLHVNHTETTYLLWCIKPPRFFNRKMLSYAYMFCSTSLNRHSHARWKV